MSEKKHQFGVWIIIKMKKMFDIIEILFVVVGILIALFIINVFFWVSYIDNNTPDINADYYALKKKNKEDKENG